MFLLFKGEGMTPAASNTCYDKYTDCAQHCDTHADECKILFGIKINQFLFLNSLLDALEKLSGNVVLMTFFSIGQLF